MVERSEVLDRVFSALADPTRREIVRRLSAGEESISDLARPFDMSLAAVSKHVRILQSAGIVHQRKEGRVRVCGLSAQPLETADTWLRQYERFWEQRLDGLGAYLQARREQP